jgi:TPR repeat protein
MLDKVSKSAESKPNRMKALFAGLILGLILQGCAEGVKETRPAPAATSAARNADDLLIVDCLLPGQIRRLGQAMTFVAPRQAIKTSGIDCAIRGGEYVAYDRSNYATALKVWMPLAEAGDKTAQTYVGEIYDKGLGIPPDYIQAAFWYRKAAEQGDRRAQLNYGYLYEKGLGVKKDPVEALNWYRKASGMSGNIVLDTGELAALKQEVEQRKQSEESLRQQLQQTREQLEKAQRELARRQRQAAAEQRRWEEERQALERQRKEAASQGDSETVKRLEEQIRQGAAKLEQQRQEVASLEQKANEYRQQIAQLDQQKGQVQALEQEVVRQKGESAALRRQLEEAREQLARVQRELEQGQAQSSVAEQKVVAARQELEREKQQAASASKAEVQKLEAQLASREAELARQQAEVKRLAAEAERYQGRLAALEKEKPQVQVKPAAPPSKPEVAVTGPKIEIIEPPVSLTRSGLPSIKTRSGMDRPIVGRVTAPAGILTFKVNDRDEKLDEYGLFRTQVAVTRANTPVNVLAVDKQGKQAKIEFVFIPEQEAAPAPVAPSRQETAGPLLPPSEFGSYYALVIGNNDYARMPKLDTAVTDAKEIAEVLSQRYGFKVTTLLNANRYQTLSALSEMREKLTANDNLLVYYAGHGELDKVNQRGHWLPVDAEPNSTANWISNVDITDILNVMTAKHVLVVADSCYSGTLTRSALGQLEAGMTRDAKINWLKTMTKKRSRTALTSGGVAPVLDAGGGNHSVFAKALLDVLKANDDVIDGSRLYREVAARVAYAATRFQVEQVPEYAPIKYAGHDFGDFFFVPVSAQAGLPADRLAAKEVMDH